MRKHGIAAFALVLLVLTRHIASGQQSPGGSAVYDLHVRIDPARARLDVSGSVRLSPLGVSRDTIAVVLSSWMKNVELRVTDPGSLAGGTLSHDSTEGDRTWKLALKAPLEARTPVTLAFRYEGDSLRAAQLRVTGDGSLAGGGGEIWYPRLAFDSGAVGTLRFDAPLGETVLSNGLLDQRASNPAAGRFVYRVAFPVKFAFVSARYTKYQRAGTPRLNLYLLRPRESAQNMLTRTADVLHALTTQFGALPYEEYSIAEVEFGGSTGGTSEFGFFLAHKTYMDAGLPVPFIGHELGHAWWGNMVTTLPGPGRMMLTEGIASFGMLRAIEEVEGPDAAEAYRQSRYPGYETSGSPREYFLLAAAGIAPPLGTTTPRGQYEILSMHRMANTRGWFLLDMLSRQIGRERMATILRGILSSYAGRALSWPDFRARIERGAAPVDVRWFFDDWFDRSGAPRLVLSWDMDGGYVRGVVQQSDTLFRVTLPVRLYLSSGGTVDRLVEVDAPATPFRFEIAGVTNVVLDPDFQVLRWTGDVSEMARGEAPLTRADFQRRFGSVRQSIALYRAALDSLPVADSSGYAFAVRYGLAAALTATADTTGGRAELEAALAMRLRRPSLVPGAYLLLARLSIAGFDTVSARNALRLALTADSSSVVKTVTETIHGLPWARSLLTPPQ